MTYLSSIDWMYIIHTNPSASSMWVEFVRLLKHAIDTFVPSFVVPTLSKQMHKPRRSRSVRKLDAKKRRLWKNLKSSVDDTDNGNGSGYVRSVVLYLLSKISCNVVVLTYCTAFFDILTVI